MLNWQTLEQNLVGGLYPAAEKGTYAPTLVLGLGGTGIKALRYLKSALSRLSASSVELLGIDSDDGENAKFPALPRLSETELIILDQAAATNVLARAEDGQADSQHVNQYLPDQVPPLTALHAEVRKKIAAQKGAGQFRRAGRLLFQANANGGANVAARFSAARQRMQGLATRIQQKREGLQIAPGARIFVVTSLAGGTGAGVVLDCIALLRAHFTGEQDTITAFCFLPGELLDRELYNPLQEKKVTRGNAIALLRELQAFDRQHLKSYKFRLDGNTTVGPLKRFIDDVYLIGDHTDAGVPANSYMELTQAVAYFLYSFVGGGVGATVASGAINGQIQLTMRSEAVPRVFNSIGVAALEYPVQELAGYAVRYSLGQWLHHWLKAKAGNADVRAAVDTHLGGEPLFLRSVETLRPQLLPAESERRAARFLPDAALRKSFLRQPDEIFVTKGLNRVDEIDAVLQGMAATFDDNAAKWREAAIAHTESWVLERLRHGPHDAAQHVETLATKLDSIVKHLVAEREKRDARIDRLREELRRDGTRIHFWDFGLDRGLRQRFLDKIDTYLALKEEEATDAYAANCLAELQNAVGGLRARLEALQNTATVWADQNEHEMHRISQQPDVPGFVQRAIAHADFAGWAKKQAVTVPEFAPPGFEWERILLAAFEAIRPNYETALRSLDVMRDVRGNDGFKRRAQTLNDASMPLIHRTAGAPLMPSMTPQKFVAGKFDDNDPVVRATFPPSAGRTQSTLVPTTNPSLLVCAQTCHGFGAAHWRPFTEAETYYRENPWYYHALEEFESLPPLQVLSEEDSEKLRLFGLGLMFELILNKGSNYYRNMVFSTRDNVCYFLVHSTGRSAEATELVGTDLIREPIKSQNRVQASHRLGDSLEAALDGLSSPASASFRQELSGLIDDFKVHRGSQATAELVRQYTQNHLATQISKATGRRDLLEKIAEALETYANSLG